MASDNGKSDVDAMKIVSGRAWRLPREEGVPVELRPDWFVLMRPVTIDVLIRRGKVPTSLAGVAIKRFQTGDGEFFEDGEGDGQPNPFKMTEELITFAVDVAKQMFVSPRIVDEPTEDDEISPDDLTTSDLGVILVLIDQPADTLRKFRYQPTSDVESVAAAKVPAPSGISDIRTTGLPKTKRAKHAGGVPLDGDGLQRSGDELRDNG